MLEQPKDSGGTHRVPRLLITYFGAFEGVPVNPTERLAHLLHEEVAQQRGADIELVFQELPVAFGDSAVLLDRVLERVKPDAVIALGVAVGREKVSIERVAINLNDARIADNSGVQHRDQPIIENAPAAYFSTLPTRSIFEQAQARNLPVELSYTAGTYVCNHVFYVLLHATAEHNTPAGFIHVPALSFEDSGESTMVAHAETGGVEGRTVPEIPAKDALEVLVLAIVETLSLP